MGLYFNSNDPLMILYEKLNLFVYLKALLLGRDSFYFRRSFAVAAVERILCSSKMLSLKTSRIKEFGWGDSVYIGSAVGNASKNAESYLAELIKQKPALSSNDFQVLNIDFLQLFRKYIFVEVLYKKYFVYELFMQYLMENKGEESSIVVDRTFIGDYEKILHASCPNVTYQGNFSFIETLFSLLLMPLILPVFWRNKISNKPAAIDNAIICHIDMPSAYDGYSDIFRNARNIVYVASPEYKSYYTEDQIARTGVHFLELTKSAYSQLRKIQNKFWSLILVRFVTFRLFGIHLLYFFTKVIKARERSPSGKGNFFFSCEHHDLLKTIRNEFIRSECSKSILFAYSSLYVLKHYPEEYFENYDYVCSPGKHYEDVLKQNKARNNVCLRTGSYVIHKAGLSQRAPAEKLDELKSYAKDGFTITVLCPGVCKPTYHSEKKLMKLARRLSEKRGVKVIIRQKPFIPEERYKGFYEQYVEGNSSMMLTGMEYDLFDFTQITDLFITSYSTSACELAVCGASVFFVDFLKQPDRFIFWADDIAGGLVLNEDEAYARICAFIDDTPNGVIRKAHSEQMEKFSKYIGYRFKDYQTYEENLHVQLNRCVFSSVGEVQPKHIHENSDSIDCLK